MSRVNWKASNLLNPLPAVIITCTDENGKSNAMTAAWCGTICSDPVMVSVSIRKNRFSHDIIQRTKEFVINLTNEDLLAFTDYVGIYSGQKIDKFNLPGKYHVTPIASKNVKAITIEESPLALECQVEQIIELGSHDMFIAKVVGCSVDEKLLDQNGTLDLKKAKLITYSHGEYFAIGKKLGKFGFTSNKKERSKRVDLQNRNKK